MESIRQQAAESSCGSILDEMTGLDKRYSPSFNDSEPPSYFDVIVGQQHHRTIAAGAAVNQQHFPSVNFNTDGGMSARLQSATPSMQLPKIVLELGRGRANGGGLIGHTQPRRIAASSVAKRIAFELNSPLGEVVGYRVRFQDKFQPGASVKLMTDGILLAETQSDPLLKAYDTIIIDEAHERSLNIDFLLGYLRQILPRRPDLKVIVTSATIDADRFAKHFESARGTAPVIMVSGRLFPVEQRWRPYVESREFDLDDAIADAVDELWRPIASEQLRRRDAGEAPTHHLLALPGASRRARRLLGPLQGLIDDG